MSPAANSTETQARKILLLGSGFVALPCAEVILRRPGRNSRGEVHPRSSHSDRVLFTENHLTIASRRLENATLLAEKLQNERATAMSVDVNNPAELEKCIADHDLTISLIPYTYHHKVIECAIKHKKHVVTTSYVNPLMAALDGQAKEAGTFFFL